MLLYREGPEKQLEVVALDLKDILRGAAPDITLKRNDMLVISSVNELEERGDVYIGGQVARPGAYPYAANSTVEDLIFQAGGLLEGASTARVDISRRIVDPSAAEATNQLAQEFTVSIENGLAVGTRKGFRLKPYDRVEVRRSPGYAPQETVAIDGEVLFAGTYTLRKRNERLSEFVTRAGGLIDGAYIKGRPSLSPSV